jgi:plasmid stabilization system protein ParE
MTKELRVLDDIAERDIPAIIAFHVPRSRAKATAIIAEYDRIVALLRERPRAFHPRPHGWRVCVFQSGPYALYYRELEPYWLVAGVYHARRDPDWIQAQLEIREARLN